MVERSNVPVDPTCKTMASLPMQLKRVYLNKLLGVLQPAYKKQDNLVSVKAVQHLTQDDLKAAEQVLFIASTYGTGVSTSL